MQMLLMDRQREGLLPVWTGVDMGHRILSWTILREAISLEGLDTHPQNPCTWNGTLTVLIVNLSFLRH
jgi:hypothetical protein